MHCQGQKREQKHPKEFVRFHNHSPLLPVTEHRFHNDRLTKSFNHVSLQDFLTKLFKFNEIKDFYETLEVSQYSICCHSDICTCTVTHFFISEVLNLMFS